MSLNACKVLDNMKNSNGFHEFVPSTAEEEEMLSCMGCGFNLYLTQKVREIASQLGVVNPNYEAFKSNKKNGALAVGEESILISQEYAAALENNPLTPFRAEEVEGSLAHEIGHLALDHSNSPLYDLCFDALDHGQKVTSDFFRACLAAVNRKLEEEADLFTLREPSLGKKLIQMFNKVLLLSGPSGPVSPFDSHPRTEDRIEYVKNAYCEKIQENDCDLCSCLVKS